MEYAVDVMKSKLECRICDSWKESLEKAWSCKLEYDTQIDLVFPLYKDANLNKNELQLSLHNDATKRMTIEVPSLRALFRGDFNPGIIPENPQPRYDAMCYKFENAWVGLAEQGIMAVPRDKDMYDYYYSLRRRPDGKANDPMHKALWQIWAFMAGSYVISEAEFTAVMTRLIRSASIFMTSIASHNMYNSILMVQKMMTDKA